MKKEQLQSLIATLHKELTAAASVDADSRALLQQLIQDIEDLAGGDEPPAERVESASGQLESAALKFESEHPPWRSERLWTHLGSSEFSPASIAAGPGISTAS
jgi:hypothetical protein